MLGLYVQKMYQGDMMNIMVRPHKAYGHIRYYAQNETAVKLLKLLVRKSFTKHQLQVFKSLGFEIELINHLHEDEYEIS